jgi:hypothetical protein
MATVQQMCALMQQQQQMHKTPSHPSPSSSAAGSSSGLNEVYSRTEQAAAATSSPTQPHNTKLEGSTG